MDNFTIISRDCHGFQYYNKEYNTPTIGNCMIIQDFIKFVKNINIINNITLKFDENYPCISKDCNYPIGLLTISENINIYIHFMHDNNKIDILNKYNRRLNRMIKTTKKNYIFFLNDLDLSKSFDLNYPRYFDITIDELNNNLIDYFSIEYGKKCFFCNENTYNKLSEKCINKSKNGIIIIIPEYIKTGGEIYNYLKHRNKYKFIYENNTGFLH